MSTPATPGSDDWVRILDRLEADLLRTEKAIGSGRDPRCEPWHPPEDVEPLPAHLRDRAEALLTRQRAVFGVGRKAAADLSRHQDLAGRMRSGRAETAGAVYLDLRA